ncbi:hypothetical protein SKAU_G00303090 [Synaphobranchus kaupii]|uniref:Uncharacterized protein n=1 Tax=Synaphobranchus kaupii TaxID=118154 RepID=A0A9Q1EW09_SYNKA|nr:hypothetical protein SKAU_G00303090 [Synaphobranchus kaupii]
MHRQKFPLIQLSRSTLHAFLVFRKRRATSSKDHTTAAVLTPLTPWRRFPRSWDEVASSALYLRLYHHGDGGGHMAAEITNQNTATAALKRRPLFLLAKVAPRRVGVASGNEISCVTDR